ncbi:MAG: VWA domain-containing protein, partial [Candidatus Pacebacteria bacterium]|nr:VWA domain-containing protein [Candidatus Paceibacterota bacterium]
MKKYIWLILAILPYLALVLVYLINPLLQTSDYCALPTTFETRMWGGLPPVIGSWVYYSVSIFFLELIFIPVWLSVSGIFLGIVSLFRTDKRSLATRRLFIGLPFTIMIVGGLVLSGLFFMLNILDLGWRVTDITALIGAIIFGILIFSSIVWLIVVGILEKRNEDPNIRKQGTRTLAAAAVGLFCGLLIPIFFVLMASLNSARGGYGGYDSAPGSINVPTSSFKSNFSDVMESATVGFSVGGAKDADNFRENIANCYLPIPTDITYEGLFYDYSFNTVNKTGCDNLFCPQYEAAIIPDPYSKEDEYFLSVGLASNIKEEDFARPPLDLVVVLDISGSMSSTFNRYYYDQFRTPDGSKDVDKSDWNRSKMEIAKESLSALVDHLHADDRFGMVVFDSSAEEFLPVNRMGVRDVEEIKNIIEKLSPRGGTNMEAGLLKGTELLKSLSQDKDEDREKRIIFLTDAMPNTGALEQNELYQIGQANAAEELHTTFIGIGVDFNTELVEALTKKIRGANYYAVHSSSDFEKRLDVEFEYLV